MNRTTQLFVTLALLGSAASGAGCATGSVRVGDLRGSAHLASSAPRLLIAGPALLMHIDVERSAGALTLYTAARRDGTDADCSAGPSGETIPVRPSGTSPLKIGVAAGEVVCLSAPAGRAALQWHARTSARPLPGNGERFVASTRGDLDELASGR
jgi:hypothetical protein